jgi:hypothetical protein
MDWLIKFCDTDTAVKIADTKKARFLWWEPGLPLWLLAELVEQYFQNKQDDDKNDEVVPE